MKSYTYMFALLAILAVLCLTGVASACPSCQGALDESSSLDSGDAAPWDMAGLPAAYNQSIYLMITVPYVLLGFFGFLIYRGMKKNEEFRRQQQEQQVGPVS